MVASSITANFTSGDPKAAQAFATAFIRNSRKSATPVVMPRRVFISADFLLRKGCR